MTPCTCGDPHPHTISSRRTYDGRLVELDSDGGLWVNGQRGGDLGAAPVRSDDAVARARRVGNACVLEAAEFGDLYRRGRQLATAPATLAELRRALEPRDALPVLAWTVTRADRDGRPLERVARLPRLRWPGMAVFDYCGGAGGSRGRYELVYRLAGGRGETYEASGFRFRRLADLWEHLFDLSAPSERRAPCAS